MQTCDAGGSETIEMCVTSATQTLTGGSALRVCSSLAPGTRKNRCSYLAVRLSAITLHRGGAVPFGAKRWPLQRCEWPMQGILVVNAGSSSVKFQTFALVSGGDPQRLIKGQIDGIGTRPRLLLARLPTFVRQLPLRETGCDKVRR